MAVEWNTSGAKLNRMPHSDGTTQFGSPVAFFASSYYPEVGGVQEVVRQLSRYRRRRGLESIVIVNRWPKQLPESASHEEVEVRRYVFRVPEPNVRQFGGALLFGPSTISKICRVLQGFGARAINIHCVSSNAYYALICARLLKLPLIVSLHGELTVDAGGLFLKSAFARNLLRSVLDAADAVTACSKRALAEAEEFYGQPFGNRAHVIYSGVGIDELREAAPYPHPRPYILAIGRLERPKGFDILLKAYRRVVDWGPADLDLILAGDGLEADALRSQAADLGLAGRVHFLGRVDRGTTARLFAGCRLFVLPSRVEPMGIVNLEAMATGKPIAASNVGGVPELVEHGQNGLLFEPECEHDMALAILRLIGDAALARRLADAGFERVQQFDWSLCGDRYCSLIDNVVEARRTDW